MFTRQQLELIAHALNQRATALLAARDSHLLTHEQAVELHRDTWAVYCEVMDKIDAIAKAEGGR